MALKKKSHPTVPFALAPLRRGFLLAFSAALSLAIPAGAAALKEIADFGYNPSNIRMYLYVPDKLLARPPVLVGLHWCHGSGPAFFTGTQFAAQADKYGFIVIYPNARSSDSCWDVHSQAALTHGGGSDPGGIVSMVRYVVRNYHADSTRVYAAGHSSGGMMTNVLLGSYPDMFKAGAAFAGVPFSCFSGSNAWNSDCASGKISKSASAWGDQVRAAFPAYTGPRPRIQLWHGTDDAVLNYNNFGEEIKEWTNVLGAGQTPATTEANTPQTTWTRTRYTDATGKVQVEAIQEQGQPHNLQILADKAVQFLGLDVPATAVRTAGGNDARGISVRMERGASPQSLQLFVSGRPGRVSLELRDLEGRRIRSWAGNYDGSGTLKVSWEGGRQNGNPLPHGICLLSAKVDGVPAGSSRFTVLDD